MLKQQQRSDPFSEGEIIEAIMASIILHGMRASTATAMVTLVLAEKKVDYDFCHVELSKGDHKQLSYLALNPFAQIPALQDGDLTIFESRAIVRYLLKKYDGQGTEGLLGKSLEEQAMVDQWCEVESNQFSRNAIGIMYEMRVKPVLGFTTDDAAVQGFVDKLINVLDVYEQRLSQSRYLAGDFFSLADLQHIASLHYVVNVCGKHEQLLASRPFVKAWWETITSRPASKDITQYLNF